MTATRLYDAGYTDLVSVVPPDAKIANTSTLRPEARGKVPGIRKADGTWVGYPWIDTPGPSPATLKQWEQDGANIGLHGDRFSGLDIDCDDELLSRLLVQEATRHLGPAPQRTSRHPRRLLVYRTEEPFSRIAIKIGYKGEEHTVEMLGAGRQYLVYGAHPSGTDYGWEGKPLWEWEPEELSPVTAEQVRQFGAHLMTLLDGRATVEVVGDGEVKEAKSPPQDELTAPDHETLAKAVAQIPNDERFDERDDYIMMGHAIKAAAGGDGSGFPIFLEWCDRWEGGDNDVMVVQADWKRMRPPYRVGWSWIREMAGFNVAQEAFTVEPDAEVSIPSDVGEGVFEHTDVWVVERLARWLADKARFVPETGHWHIWGGK